MVPVSDIVPSSQMVSLRPAATVAAWLMVTVSIAAAAAHPPPAAIEFVITYVPGVEFARSISPVAGSTNTSPAALAEKVPALAPGPNTGVGFGSEEQKLSGYPNNALGAVVIVTFTILLLGQTPFVWYVML